MDHERFDAWSKALATGAESRRGLVRTGFAAIAAAALAALNLSPPDDAWAESGKCKKDCDECEKCEKGDCERKNGKKTCKPGKCKAKDNGVPCSAGTCQGGSCVPTQPLVSPPPPTPPPPPPPE